MLDTGNGLLPFSEKEILCICSMQIIACFYALQVIVISRQFGSGGRKIGRLLSDRLQIPYYDMALIEMAAKRSDSDYTALLEVDEKKVTRKWYEFSTEVGREYQMKRIPMNEELFTLQAEIIKDLAAQGPCIIIGRGADYILRENERMLSVFIHADTKTKQVHPPSQAFES